MKMKTDVILKSYV